MGDLEKSSNHQEFYVLECRQKHKVSEASKNRFENPLGIIQVESYSKLSIKYE